MGDIEDDDDDIDGNFSEHKQAGGTLLQQLPHTNNHTVEEVPNIHHCDHDHDQDDDHEDPFHIDSNNQNKSLQSMKLQINLHPLINLMPGQTKVGRSAMPA